MHHKIKKTIGIIPARYASTRFPGKPLVEIQGKSMIERVYEQAQKVEALTKVVVATDDERIYNHVTSFDGEVIMTAANHRSGTDRCAEVLTKLGKNNFDVVVNIQGDEPFINPIQISQLCQIMSQGDAELATLIKQIDDAQTLFNENIVKVVQDKQGNALYFSRNPIPFLRGVEKDNWLEKTNYYKHIGLYAYRADVLLEIAKLEPSTLEIAESLEQLRWLEQGYRIHCGVTLLETKGIDTPEDLDQINIIQ